MIMPYGTKATAVDAAKGRRRSTSMRCGPAYVPVITALGYEAVRADRKAAR